MNIVFDMDNTLTDELGSSVRPGITDLLDSLLSEGHKLILWTNSGSQRAKQIIMDNGLKRYFSSFIFREDYDPGDKGIMKDIRRINGDILIDDDPAEITFVKSLGKKGYLIKPYRKKSPADMNELKELRLFIKKCITSKKK